MDANATNDEQTALWNGPAGHAWVASQALLDQMFQPFEALLVDTLPASASGVLDVGCGTGSTTLAAARRLGSRGPCVGIDLSGPMIALARERAAREGSSASFIEDSAETHAFEPATFDALISRFGVMFFGNAVAAFQNLRRSAKPGAALHFISWRSASENAFMTTAERVAAPRLPDMPARRLDPDAPGQFALALAPRIHDLLAQSGWTEPDLRPIDVPCTFPERELDHYIARLGPLGVFLQNVDDATRRAVLAEVRAAFAPYLRGEQVCFTAACWSIRARAAG
jgi:SAM-dependent methyltransferase